MAVLLHVLSLFSFLTVLLIFGTHGIKIQFFKYKNFTELVLESNSSEVCNDFPDDEITEIDAIRTDTCFIVYNDWDCKSILSAKHMPGNITLSKDDQSQICNEEEGGSQLNLDITKFINTLDPSAHVLESYRNVCSCINVPKYVQQLDRWTINNHHNELLAYFEPNCSVNKWNPKFIVAGHNYLEYENMQVWRKMDKVTNTDHKIQSFGPDINSTYFKISCLNLSYQLRQERNEKTFGITKGIVTNVNAENDKRLRILTSQSNKNYPFDASSFVILSIIIFLHISILII